MRRYGRSSAYNYRATVATNDWLLKEFTFAEMLEQSISASIKFPNENGVTSYNSEFYGSSSWNDTVHSAKHGNDEVTEQVRKLVERISGTFSFTSTSDYIYDVTGLTLDVGTLLSGDPNCWLQPIETKSFRSDKLIDITTEVNFSGGTDKNDIAFRGALIASLVDALRQRGFSVKLAVTHCIANIAFTYQGKSYNGAFFKTNLINYGELPHLSLIAFYFADISCYRRLQFSLWNAFTNRTNTACHCHASNPPEQFRGKYHIDSNDGLFDVGYRVTEEMIVKGQQWLEAKLKEISETY